jgi:hypothetical protein
MYEVWREFCGLNLLKCFFELVLHLADLLWVFAAVLLVKEIIYVLGIK